MARTLVVADIDGTLLEHPYWTDVPFERKAETCRRMIEMLRRRRLCLCTGRPRRYYESLLREFGNDCVYPWYLVAECGGEVVRDGETVFEREPDPALAALEEDLRDWSRRRGLAIDDDPGETSVIGICFERRRCILDVDWNLGEQARNDAMQQELFSHMQDVVDESKLRLTVYPEIRRITACSADFQPKVSIWPAIRSQLGEPDDIWVVGDEPLDRDAAEAIKIAWPKSRVRFASTNPKIDGDLRLACGVETIDFIERVLG